MIDVVDIRKTYLLGETEVHALRGVSVHIARGEFIALMGPSGSGKSTLLQLMGLLDTPDEGRLSIGGRDASRLTEDEAAELRGEAIGFVFQQFNLLSRTTAVENVVLPMIYRGIRADPAHGISLLGQVELGARTDHKPNELSGGQQQRVAIARALVNKPSILLADEPTGNLDSASADEIMRLFQKLNRESGITVVVVTHEDEVAAYASRVIRLKDGKIVSDVRKSENAAVAATKEAPLERVSRDLTFAAFYREWVLHFRQGMRSLRANPVRSGLSMLGILIGVASVIAMIALGNGAKISIEEQLSSMGSNLLNISPGGGGRPGAVSLDPGTVTRFNIEDAHEIKRVIAGVKNVGALVNGKARVAFGNKNLSTNVMGTEAHYAVLHNTTAIVGRFFTEEEDRARARVAVLGMTVVRGLFEDRNPVGETIKMNKITFTVIGVAKERGMAGFRDMDDQIFIPVNTAMQRLLGKKFVDSIEVEAENAEIMPDLEDAIRDLVMRRHRLQEDQRESFNIRNMAEIQNALSGTSRVMSMLLSCIAAISLLVGGIGIMNIMLVSVTERTREIGLRKALGARRRDILFQFLTEAVVVSGSGGLIGVLLGLVVSYGMSFFAGWATYISPVAVLFAVFFSAGIGVFFGLWPAKKAASLSPIVALRSE